MITYRHWLSTFRKLSFAAALLVMATVASATGPATLYWDGEHLAKVRADVAAGTASPTTDVIANSLVQLKGHAEQALTRGPYSVVDKSILPPSGDKHDYLSFSRYWWPNPDAEDGLPYVRRDGETNRKLLARGDRNRLGMLCDDVETLALAAYLLHDAQAGNHARKLIRTWFLNEETRMTPRLMYSQGVPGRSVGRGTGIIDTRHFLRVADSIVLLHAIETIDDKELDELKQWFDQYASWLLTHKLGNDERNAKNNHGMWYAAQVVGLCLFVDRKADARELLLEVRDDRVPKTFAPDGSQPEELSRTRSLHYSIFNLGALSTLARLGEPLAIDLWHHQPDNGAGMARAFEYIRPYLSESAGWPHPEMGEFALSDREAQTLLLAAKSLGDRSLLAPLSQAKTRYRGRHFAPLLFPAEWSEEIRAEQETQPYQVTTDPNFTPPPLEIDLPDLKRFSVEAVRQSIPEVAGGVVRIAPAADYRLLDEAFRKQRGRDLQQRQKRETPQVIVLESGIMTLAQVVDQIDNADIAQQQQGVVTLRLPLLIQPKAALVIRGDATPTVRLSTTRGTFLANAGRLFAVDTEFTSWNEAADSPSQGQPTLFTKKEEFRPFLASYVRSETYIAESQIRHLGFAAATAYGLSLSSHPERDHSFPEEEWPHGILVGNVFEGLYYGFYSYQARDVAIVDNDYKNCIVYGIDPHDRSTRLVIAKNRTYGTIQKHGIIGSRGVSHSWIFDNKSYENHGAGIMLDRQSDHNLVYGNQVYRNGQGIALYESPANMLVNNLVAFNADSGIRIRNSVDIEVRENTIYGNQDYALELYAKRLDDHQKRTDRGDLYQQSVSAKVFENQISHNRGFAKATNVESLQFFRVAKVDLEKIEQSIASEVPPPSDNASKWLGQELKPLKKTLRPLFKDSAAMFSITKPAAVR